MEKGKYKITKKINIIDGDVVSVFCAGQRIAYEEYFTANDFHIWRLSFKELLERAGYDFEDYSPAFILIEKALGGVIFSFGNYDRAFVYEHGKTQGYA